MDRSPSGISPFVLIRHSVLSTVSSRYPELRGTYPYCPIPFAALGSPKEPCRSTCMPNPRRQRSFWARVKPFNSFYFHFKRSFVRSWVSLRSKRKTFILNRFCWLENSKISLRRFLTLYVSSLPDCQISCRRSLALATTGNNIALLLNSSTGFFKNFYWSGVLSS